MAPTVTGAISVASKDERFVCNLQDKIETYTICPFVNSMFSDCGGLGNHKSGIGSFGKRGVGLGVGDAGTQSRAQSFSGSLSAVGRRWLELCSR